MDNSNLIGNQPVSIKEIEQEIGKPISSLPEKQLNVLTKMLKGNTFKNAMKGIYHHGHISRIVNKKYKSGNLAAFLKLYEKHFVAGCKKVHNLGEKTAETLNAIILDPKQRAFDKIQAIKQQWVILSSSREKPSNIPMAVNARNVMILANPKSIEEFNSKSKNVEKSE